MFIIYFKILLITLRVMGEQRDIKEEGKARKSRETSLEVCELLDKWLSPISNGAGIIVLFGYLSFSFFRKRKKLAVEKWGRQGTKKEMK